MASKLVVCQLIKVEPESLLHTVRLREQLVEDQRHIRWLDAKLQANEHRNFFDQFRLTDLEDESSLEPEPDVDDMLLLPLHINEVLRVLRAASSADSEVICVPLRCAHVSMAIGEALEETKSRSSAALLSEVSLLLYQLTGKEVLEPTVAPEEAGGRDSPRSSSSRDLQGPRFPKPRPWQGC